MRRHPVREIYRHAHHRCISCSGLFTRLLTLLWSLTLGGGALSALQRLPHVAGVAGRHDAEKVRRIVDEVTGFINAHESRHTFLWLMAGMLLVPRADFEDIAEAITKIAADGPSARCTRDYLPRHVGQPCAPPSAISSRSG